LHIPRSEKELEDYVNKSPALYFTYLKEKSVNIHSI